MIRLMHSQNRMNYELRAIRFNHSGSIFGAEHMGKICTLTGGKKQTCDDNDTYKIKEVKVEVFCANISLNIKLRTIFSAEMAAK